MNMFSFNAAELQPKLNNFKCEISRTNAGLFTVQESHYASKGKVQIENYEFFEAIRKSKEKVGTIIGAHKALKSILINAYNDHFKIIVIEIKAANKEIRVISGYGPQETWTPTERLPFFESIKEEVIKAELAGKSVIIEADFNSKLGKDFISNDPHDISPNGRVLAEIIRRQTLTVLNGSVKCKGTITRVRVTAHLTQRSV